jgi:hypothetical protein
MTPVSRALQGFRDATALLRGAPLLFASCWTVLTSFRLVIGDQAFLTLVSAFALAPVLIATHRHLLLGECRNRPVWSVYPNYPRFMVWLLAVIGGFVAAALVWPVSHAVSVVLLAAVGVASLGTMTLLPAIAIGDEAATYRNCLAALRLRAVEALLALAIGAVPGVALIGLSQLYPAAPIEAAGRLALGVVWAAISARMR